MKFVSILSLLVLSAIGLAESRRRRRRRNRAAVDEACNKAHEEVTAVECDAGLVCCGAAADAVEGTCSDSCEEAEFDINAPAEEAAPANNVQARRYRRRRY
jgi:hypothetical protein